VEGRPDILIKGGQVVKRNMKKELITVAQLESAARKQGFSSLSDVEECALEPGGALCFVAKRPPTEELRHQEVLQRIEKLMEEVARLRGSQPRAAT